MQSILGKQKLTRFSKVNKFATAECYIFDKSVSEKHVIDLNHKINLSITYDKYIDYAKSMLNVSSTY